MNATVYLIRELNVHFSLVGDNCAAREMDLRANLSDHTTWDMIERVIHLAAGSFLETGASATLEKIEEPMIEVELEYAEMPEDGNTATSRIGVGETEAVTDDLRDALANLLCRALPHFKRKVTLITILADGGVK